MNMKQTNISISVSIQQQQGAALIAVMLFLIVIAIVGILAVKRSSTDLKVATADQMNTVLLQSSESANQRLESIVNGAATSTEYKQVVESTAGAIGYFLNNEDAVGDEFSYCFDTRERKYLRNNATIFRGTGILEGGNNGTCYKNSEYQYTSGRNVVATRLSIHLPLGTALDPETNRGGHYGDGASVNGATAVITRDFDVYTTSVLPAYGNPSDCLGKRSSPVASAVSFSQTASGCLANASSSTPHNVIRQEIRVTNETNLSVASVTASGTLVP